MRFTRVLGGTRPAAVGATSSADDPERVGEPRIVGRTGTPKDIQSPEYVEVPAGRMMKTSELGTNRLSVRPALIQASVEKHL